MKTHFFFLFFPCCIFSLCPNHCSKNGYCNNSGVCECYPSFHGIDCSIRVCPSGTAWFDEPTSNDVAHGAFRECSNMGNCNRKTGVCECRPGFTGPACNMMACSQGISSSGSLLACSGHGKCASLRSASATSNFLQFFNGSTYSDWDADMIHGCVCDSGWHGVNCSLRSCPYGNNPSYPGLPAVQLIDCTCDDYHCLGSFQLTARGQTTITLPINSTEEVISFALQQLSTIEIVSVNIIGEKFCSRTGSTTVIKFKLPSDSRDVVSIDIINATTTIFKLGEASALNPTISSFNGTTQYAECSNHGICDYVTGICDCFDGYGSSDGYGNVGTRGDCGYMYSATTSYNINGSIVTTRCPYEYNGINGTKEFCSGNGYCDSFTDTCVCYSGFEGAGCHKKTCGSGKAWFGNIQKDHHADVMCSGIGDCNFITGECENCGGTWGLYEGDTCSQMTCKSTDGVDCSGNGVCLTLREMALLTYNSDKTLAGVTYSTSWDADMIRGCSCYRTWSVNEQYSLKYFPLGSLTQSTSNNYNHSKFYRGPYAFSATNWIGYDCSLASCPTGLDPSLASSRIGNNEIQMLQCDASSGYLKLQFRENTTRPIPWNSTASQLEGYLEELYTIGDVKVTIVGPETYICDSTNVTIEFLSEFGNLPDIIVNTTLLSDPATNHITYYLANITTIQDGTKSDMECSAMGICNEASGQCSCMLGYSSSDGTLTNVGERGDCSYYDKYYGTTNRL